ncbi:MAG: energy transducer TonB [Rhodospirillales bacterium]|nr:energy transducer TonB [Rhodospirillales bacterium]
MSRAALLSLLLHVLVLAVLLISIRPHRREEFVQPSTFALVFENGGAPRATAPPAIRHGPPLKASAPARPLPPPPPAPPPRVTPSPPAPPRVVPPLSPPVIRPGFAVHLPPSAEVQAFLQPPPLPRPAPAPAVPPAPARPPAPPQHALVLGSLSYGNAPHPAPAVPSRGLNLALSQSEIRHAFAPDFAIRGNIGPDWRAELTRWVDRRKYYPYAAAEMGQQGSVEINLVISRTGRVETVRLLRSSGSPFLDSAWLGLFRNARVPPFPPGTKADRITIRATMHYILID